MNIDFSKLSNTIQFKLFSWFYFISLLLIVSTFLCAHKKKSLRTLYISIIENLCKLIHFYLFLSFLSLFIQFLIVEITCFSQDVQLQSACSDKFLSIQKDRIFANQNTDNPRKCHSVYCCIFSSLSPHKSPRSWFVGVAESAELVKSDSLNGDF